MKPTSLIAAGLVASGASAAGINCNGSALCSREPGNLQHILSYSGGLDDNRWYQNGQHIICQTSTDNAGLCAFLKNTGGLPGREIKRLLIELENHGCKKCGSVPAFYPSDNNSNSHGELTVNFVQGTNCQGIC
ncbi:hypothetical protein NM208_g11930 [Fusarium decemcellulare]|uniref:Uncharacterized protein n=1 Tax=Fusarium decemcellulare TaxID=57161 RepID=A0ACC1RTX5_9HYPO|nr:hypothetical protein NM208_g11930 [Fusarium decemcellulare]